jgi:putative transposase
MWDKDHSEKSELTRSDLMSQKQKEVYLHDEAVYKVVKEVMEKYLPLPERGKDYTAREIYDVLLAAASQDTSVDNVCHSSETGPSANTVRQRVRAAYDLNQVEKRINQALAEKLSRKLFKRGQPVAIDLVLTPYYGKETEATAAELVRGERRDGTTRFHAYATAYVIVNGERFTLALTFVWAEDRLPQVLSRLRQRVRQMGIKTKLLLLDRAFFTVEIIAELQGDGQPSIIPVIVRGKLVPPGGTRVLVVTRSSQWTRYRMKSASGQTVTFEVAVAAQNGAAHRSRSGQQWKKGRQVRAYAVYGVRSHPLAIAQIYRRRFGIESSYRQLHQGRARTSCSRAVFRLWLVGLALLLRNLWIWIRFQVTALPRRGRRLLPKDRFTFQWMLRWIARLANERLGLLFRLRVFYPLPSELMEVA